jgi:predicted transcriptional regulator
MTRHRIISHEALKAEMQAVARGEKPAPSDAATASFNSVEALARLLTPENRSLLAVIRDRKPQSIAELAKLTGRAESNLTRTLDKLGAMGLLTFETEGRRKVPTANIGRITVEIDPFGADDRLEMHRLS